jgi:hypothetical protein
MIELISAILLAGSMPVTNEADPDPVALRVRAYADEQVDKATARSALEVGEHLLASAGLVVAWRVCDTAQSCPMGDTAVPEIVVILSSRDRQNGRENCGVAAHGARDSAGTVMVSVPCVAGVAFRLTRRPGTGTNPLLAMPRHDDLIGAIVAHEIGHLLGIRHAPAGLMRASLETDDMIALRRGSCASARRKRAGCGSQPFWQERNVYARRPRDPLPIRRGDEDVRRREARPVAPQEPGHATARRAGRDQASRSSTTADAWSRTYSFVRTASSVSSQFFRRATCDRTSKPCDVSLVSASEPSFSGAISSPSASRN